MDLKARNFKRTKKEEEAAAAAKKAEGEKKEEKKGDEEKKEVPKNEGTPKDVPVKVEQPNEQHSPEPVVVAHIEEKKETPQVAVLKDEPLPKSPNAQKLGLVNKKSMMPKEMFLPGDDESGEVSMGVDEGGVQFESKSFGA